MLHEFLNLHRFELVKRCREKVAKRFEPARIPAVVDHGVPLFLQQLTDTLRLQQIGLDPTAGAPEPMPGDSEIGRSAALHGAELLRRGYSVDQVVHDYGDLCQAVTELAIEKKVLIDAGEFRFLNGCLDNAIADAVSAFGQARHIATSDHVQGLHERLDIFVEEQRRLVKAFARLTTRQPWRPIG